MNPLKNVLVFILAFSLTFSYAEPVSATNLMPFVAKERRARCATSLGYVNLADIEYSNLTRMEKKQLPDPGGRDGSIEMPGHSTLDLMYNQVLDKTPNHGELHGCPVEANGKAARTEANALKVRDEIIKSAKEPTTVWYENGQYQGGTARGINSINLYDSKKNIITVFEKRADGTNKFLTTCRPTPTELDHFQSTNGNFLTDTQNPDINNK